MGHVWERLYKDWLLQHCWIFLSKIYILCWRWFWNKEIMNLISQQNSNLDVSFSSFHRQKIILSLTFNHGYASKPSSENNKNSPILFVSFCFFLFLSVFILVVWLHIFLWLLYSYGLHNSLSPSTALYLYKHQLRPLSFLSLISAGFLPPSFQIFFLPVPYLERHCQSMTSLWFMPQDFIKKRHMSRMLTYF